MDDVYHTPATEARYETKVKGSRFIAECRLVSSPEDATTALASIRKGEHAATHHCYAWRVGLFDDMKFKYSDDGEPSGTAGRPIYDAMCGRGLDNVLVVVTRYYGGTKLGTGGLARAYGEAAAGALDAAGSQKKYLTAKYRVVIDFGLFDQLNRMLAKFEARQVKADYSDRVTLEIEIRLSRSEVLVAEIIELSGGKATVEQLQA
ncbi:MAG: YigZ family protein [candidate division Zixibacteria bacterium]|nr:YigZ family protein [candidate division Zixibacteria bacterium]